MFSAYRPIVFCKVLALAFCCLPLTACAQEMYIVHCLNGACPTGMPASNDLVVREIYALSNNGNTKFADWVAYRVTRETVGTSVSLNREWKNDDLLDPKYTLEGEEQDRRRGEDDYKGAWEKIKTDRGHQAPLAAFAGTHFWRVTNILSNITPQKSNLNQGPWKELETAVRDTAYRLKELYVVTGPLFDENENQMELPGADEDHRIPTGYFKVIVHKKSKKNSAFIFDQDVDRSLKYCEGIAPLSEVESKSGLAIFPRAEHWSGDLLSDLGCGATGR